MCIRDSDNTESMVFDPQEIMDHGGLFGVDHEEWEKSPQFHEKVMERQEHQQEREQAFPVSYTHLHFRCGVGASDPGGICRRQRFHPQRALHQLSLIHI